jgi:hypothetical protein
MGSGHNALSGVLREGGPADRGCVKTEKLENGENIAVCSLNPPRWTTIVTALCYRRRHNDLDSRPWDGQPSSPLPL